MFTNEITTDYLKDDIRNKKNSVLDYSETCENPTPTLHVRIRGTAAIKKQNKEEKNPQNYQDVASCPLKRLSGSQRFHCICQP